MKKLVFFFSFLLLLLAGAWLFDYEALLNSEKKRIPVTQNTASATEQYPVGPVNHAHLPQKGTQLCIYLKNTTTG